MFKDVVKCFLRRYLCACNFAKEGKDVFKVFSHKVAREVCFKGVMNTA